MEIILPHDELALARGLNRKLAREMDNYDREGKLTIIFMILLVASLLILKLGDR